MKVGIIAEDSSDVETLKVLIRRLKGDNRLSVKWPSFGGGPNMLNKGWKHLNFLFDEGCTHFVICYDSDGHNPEERFREAADRIVRPSQVSHDSCCIVIPVQEIEAWLLADLPNAAPKVFKGWRNPPEFTNPESIASPKERLERESRGTNKKPRYSHAIHNPQMAEHIDFQALRKRCSSFIQLDRFVRQEAFRPPFPKPPELAAKSDDDNNTQNSTP